MIHIINNFCNHYDDLILEAESAKYAEYETAGVTYPFISLTDAQWAYHEIDRHIGGRIIEPVLDGFRRFHKDQPFVATWIHSDASMAEWSAILSCARPGQDNGALCFWRHRKTNWVEPDISNPAGVVMTSKDGTNRNAWSMRMRVELDPNTMVIFPAALYHSRWPNLWNQDHARTIQVFFFNYK